MTRYNDIISVPFHWSKQVIVISVLTTLLIIGAIIALEYVPIEESERWLKVPLQILLALTLIITIGFVPTQLNADIEQVTLKKVFGNIEIPLHDIREVRRLSKSDLNKSIRIFGSGGMLGYFGFFYSKKIGLYTMYATEEDNMILIRTDRKSYIFSCTKPDEFIEYITNSLR